MDKERKMVVLYLPRQFAGKVKEYVPQREKNLFTLTNGARGLTFQGEMGSANPAHKYGYVLLRFNEWKVTLSVMQGGVEMRKRVRLKEEGEPTDKLIEAQNRKIDFRVTRPLPEPE